MSQNARLNPTLSGALRRVGRGEPRAGTPGRATPGGVLGRMSVGQKFALAGLLLGGPFLVQSGVRVVSQGQELRALTRERTAGQLLRPMAGVLQDTIELRLAAVTMLTDLSSDAAATTVDRRHAALRSSLTALAEQFRTAGYGAEATDVQGLATTLDTYKRSLDDLTVSSAAAQRMYSEFLSRALPPIFAGVAQSGGLDRDSSDAVRALAQLATVTLPRELPIAETAVSSFTPTLSTLRHTGTLLTNATKTETSLRWQASNDSLTQIQDTLKRVSSLSAGSRADLDRAAQTLQAVATPLMTQLYSGTVTSATLEFGPDQLRAATRAYHDALFNVQTTALSALERELNAAVSAKRRQVIAQMVLALLLVVIAGLLVSAIARSITEPLHRLIAGTRRMQAGELHIEVPVTSHDELGTLTTTFNSAVTELRRNQERSEFQVFEAAQLQQNVSAFLDVTMEIAGGDLTRRGAVTEDVLGNVVDSINLMTDELAGTLRGVREVSATVTDGSQAMLGNAELIADGTRATSAYAQRMTVQAQELSQGIRTMAAIARASAEASRRALAAAQQGEQAVSDTLGGMDAIRTAAQDTTERVRALESRSAQIGEIVETISHIASQVNLLALHASIEAAGAGPSGARFAVVAEEVRQLADESTAATASIGTLIGELRADIAQVARGAKENAAHVERGVTVAGSAGDRLREIGELAGITAQLAQNISTSTDQQVRGVTQMAEGTRHIAEVASTSQDSATRARAAADQLAQLARDLDTTLARFRLS